MRHKWVTAIFGTLLAGPSAGFALCLTEDGLPASSLAPIVETALTAHQDGSARYVHLLEIADFNADGLLDMILAVKDESYSGAPVFDLSYFQGTNEGWCGTAVASGLAALNSDVNVSITPAAKTGGFPDIAFHFTQVDLAQNTAMDEVFAYRYDDVAQQFQQTASTAED